MSFDYEVAIIGAGSAGLSARREVAKVTDNYVVIDDGILGTTCARVGCMPSKVLIQAANDFHRRHKFEQMGISGGEQLSINPEKVMEHVRSLRDRFVRAVIEDMKSWSETKLISKRAYIKAPNTLELRERGSDKVQTVTAKRIILATGSSPIIPEICEKCSDDIIDTNSFFELKEVPRRVLVVGLGVIGLELGQALSRIGVEVAGVTRSERVGGTITPEIQEYSLKHFRKDFPITVGELRSVEKASDGIHVKTDDYEVVVDKIFACVGRRPNLDKLGAENLGIKLNDWGLPNYDPSTSLIDGTDVFIAGDMNGDLAILHEAADEGKIAGYNAVHPTQSFKRRVPMTVVFSDPNVGFVGEDILKLNARKADYVVGKVSFEGQGRSIVKLKEVGMLHLYADRKTGKLLGSEMFGPEMEHIAHLLSWCMEMDLTVQQILSFPFYHPVIEEGLRTALRDAASQLDCELPPLEVQMLR